MGYEGFDQQLCDHGHYNETNYIDLNMPFKCIVVQCEGEVAWSNPVDDTNYDRYGYVSMSTFECRSPSQLRLCFSWAGTELIPVKTYRLPWLPSRPFDLPRQGGGGRGDRDAEVHAELDRLLHPSPEDLGPQLASVVLDEALKRIDDLEAALAGMLWPQFVWDDDCTDPFVECPGCYGRQPLDHSGDFEWEPVGPIEHARSCPSHLIACKKQA
jgi:hypothetical protein